MNDADRQFAARMSRAYNQAVDAWQSGNRQAADTHVQEALAANLEVQELNPYVLGWRAMILYNRGINLLRLHDLEACSPIPESKVEHAVTILGVWEDFVETAAPLAAHLDFVHFFRGKHDFDIGAALNAVRHDPIYRRSPVQTMMDGETVLVPWFGSPESALRMT